MTKKTFITGQDCNRPPDHLRKRCPIQTETAAINAAINQSIVSISFKLVHIFANQYQKKSMPIQ